jgi:DNA polymerase-4
VDLLARHFGFWGHVLSRMGKGIDDTPVSFYYEDKPVKSVGHSYTLPRNTLDEPVLRSYLLMLCEKTGSRMRSYSMRGRTVSVAIRYSDFSTFSRQRAVYFQNSCL